MSEAVRKHFPSKPTFPIKLWDIWVLLCLQFSVV